MRFSQSAIFEMSRFLLAAMLLSLLSACGTMAAPPAAAPQAGIWVLRYSGECAGRAAERIHITQLDAATIAFADFTLRADAAGDYVGSAMFSAPMPADGRDIPYEIAYRLRPAGGGFHGSETVIESGGHGIACPVGLVFIGEP